MSLLSEAFSLLFHDSKASRTFPFSGTQSEFFTLIQEVSKKYGMKHIKNQENEIHLLMIGSNVILASSFEGLMSAQCYIRLEREENQDRLRITAYETLISPLKMERKNFDSVIECKLNAFMSYLSTVYTNKQSNGCL